MDNRKADAIRKKAENYIREYHMMTLEDCVIAGVSGGADSIALLDMLIHWQGQYLKKVYAVHIHHGIRGKEADRDADFVENFCKSRGITCIILRKNVKLLARKWKIGEEEAGRKIRYEAFEVLRQQLLEEKGASSVKIAVAHHGDDLAETMLHHIARGTGLRGLGGIRPVQGERIRPLLCLERGEIEAYLESRELSYMTDSTNFSQEYTRNRIRHQILGGLKREVNPRAVTHMRELSVLADQADQYLEEAALEKLKVCAGFFQKENQCFLPEEFFQEKEILLHYAVRKSLQNLAGSGRDFCAEHIRSVVQLAGKQVGREQKLPCRIQALRVYGGILLKKKEENENSCEKERERKAVPCSPGTVVLGEIELELNIFFNQGQKIPEKKYTKWLDYDRIEKEVCFRRRLPGDYLIVNQEGGRKKLNRYFIDEKIAADQRDKIWLLASGSEIFWIFGGRISESARIKKNTRRILEIKYKGERYHE